MSRRFKELGLISIGLVAGIAGSLHFSAVAEKEMPLPLPVEELRAFSDVFGRIKSDYVEPVSDKKLITEAINGMLSGLDPHSAYLDAEGFKELQVGTQGEFGGLGIEVGMEDGLVKVISPIEDTPAFKAGIQSGDLIIKLDDTLVKGITLNDAVKRMRGKPGSTIRLTIVRKSEPKPFQVDIVRAVIKVQSVKYKLPEPGYGFVRITQFQEHTGENLAAALADLRKQNKVPLQRSGRLADSGSRCVRRFPAQGCAGGLHRGTYRRCAHAPVGQPRLLSARQQAGLSEGSARRIQQRADGGAGERRLCLCFGDRCRCAAGS